MALPESLAQFPRERTWLLPALQAVQRAERWLSPASLEAHRRPPTRAQERGLGHRQPLSRAPPERARPPRRARLHGPGLPVARRPRRARGLRATPRRAGRTDDRRRRRHARGAGLCVRLRQRPRRRRRSRLPRPGEPCTRSSRSSPARRPVHSPRRCSRDGAGHASERGLPGRSFHGAQARSGAASHGRAGWRSASAPAGWPSAPPRRSRRCARRSSGAACRSAWSRPAATACAGRSRSSRSCATAGPASPRGRSRRHRPAIPQRARRRHAGARDRWRRRVPGAAAPGPPRALRHGRPVRHRRRPAARRLRRLCRALDDGRPERVIEEVRAAGLAGRGGAYFQTAVKWTGCRAAAGSPKFLVVNGEEGEPGIFKDRHLMEGDPHRLLEAVLLAAFAAGAVAAPSSISMARPTCRPSALAVAARAGPGVGSRGAEHPGLRPVARGEIRRGAGGFVLGEETALLESIEGQRAMPRTRPPFPVESGLFGRPTVINNVETLFAVPSIVERGGGLVRGARGWPRHQALRPLRPRPTARRCRDGDRLHAAHADRARGRRLGRAAGIPRRGRRRSLRARRAPAPVRRAAGPARGRQSRHRGRRGARRQRAGRARRFARCSPSTRANRAASARPAARAPRVCWTCWPARSATRQVKTLAETVQLASLCGLGQAAPLSLLSGLAEFPAEFGVS